MLQGKITWDETSNIQYNNIRHVNIDSAIYASQYSDGGKICT